MGYIRHQEYLNAFGQNLRKIREQKNISQHELSFITDLSANQIGRIERGEINTSISTLVELSRGLNIAVKELFDF